MLMKQWRAFWKEYRSSAIWVIAVLTGLSALLLYKLGTLTGGISASEAIAGSQAVGWRGIWNDPLYLPLKLLRSVVFFTSADHGQLLTRLPNAIFGGLTMVGFGWLMWNWHGKRTALFTTLLFATSAWVLHVSRLASFEVVYLWAITTMLIIQVLLHRYSERVLIFIGCLLMWGLLLYIPGMVWFILLHAWLQRSALRKGWQALQNTWQRVLALSAVLVWLPVLGIHLTRSGQLFHWLGLPTDWPTPLLLLKQLIGVPVHLFLRGPQYPEQWLGRAPILDAFTLIACIVGIYFYALNWHSSRSRSIGLLFGLGIVLVTLGGPVGISVLIPILYVAVAAGLTYLLRDWLKVFPNNPLARGLGIGLVSLAVALSCLYNARAYFIAWPHNTVTKATFQHRL
jgi:hypothetical protein